MKKWAIYIVVLAICGFLSLYKLDYYVMKPGNAYEVGQFLDVDNADEDDEGTFSLMTVSMYQATPILYIWAKMKDYYEILDIDNVRQEEEDDEEYNVRQLHLMTTSQFNALYNAFSKADLPFNVTYEGVYVLNILKDGAADGVLKPGDEIEEIEGERIDNLATLGKVLDGKKKGDKVTLIIKRNDEQQKETVTLKEIPGTNGRIGIGITYSESKTIKTDPKVEVDADEIGGPSAGLMFTLGILNELLDEDISKGYTIAGTGEMLEDGTVGRIGGIDKKIVAADDAGIEIFFAPDDEVTDEMLKENPSIESNYDVAVKTAKAIHSDMKIVPVKTLDDALAYLDKLQPK